MEGRGLWQDELSMWKEVQEEGREGRAENGRGRTAMSQEASVMGRNADSGEKGEREKNSAEMVLKHGTQPGTVAGVESCTRSPTSQQCPQA